MTTVHTPGQLKRRWPLLVGVVLIMALAWGVRRFQEYRLYRSQALEAQRADKEAVQVKA